MQKEKLLSGVVTGVLILAILPSFTALSESYVNALPGIAGKMGPLNPLKFFSPFLLLFVVIEFLKIWKSRLGRSFLILGSAWVVGTVFTVLAARRCDSSTMFLREWASITLGLLAGAALWFLDSNNRRWVFTGWTGILFLAVFLDLAFPSVIDALYAHVFDPQTRVWDVPETGTHALTGVFGRQSAAKLMAWVPWLVLPAALAWSRKSMPLFLAVLGVWSGLILATSQRGPTLAAFAALFVFGAHRAWWEKSWKPALFAGAAILIGAASIFITVPSEITGPRVLQTAPVTQSGEEIPNATQILKTSNHNAHFRIAMTRASLDSIVAHPMGDACIPKSFFAEHEVAEGHSHSLFLEQFRSRGWLWGLVHLGLWLLAGFAFLRSKSLSSSGYLASYAAILICGLVDHPWFVLNQSIVLSTVLVAGISLFFNESATTSDEI